MTSEKKVTIVIPAYKPQFFLQALKSAIGQTYKDIQIVVSDNCPTEEIKYICDKFPSVKYFRNTEVGYANILSSLYGCDGDYIKPLLDDDILHPFCVQRMVQIMDCNDLSFVFSSSQVIDIENRITENRRPIETNLEIDHINLTRAMILNFRNFIGELSSIMISKKILNEIQPAKLSIYGNYDCKKGLCDVAIYLNLTSKKNTYYIDEYLSYFRRDDRMQSNSLQDPVNNPNFRYAVTDWIELLIQVHMRGLINNSEIKERKIMVNNFLNLYLNNYPVISEHNIIFEDYINKI